jgi:quinol monooxygenase YgiN
LKPGHAVSWRSTVAPVLRGEGTSGAQQGVKRPRGRVRRVVPFRYSGGQSTKERDCNERRLEKLSEIQGIARIKFHAGKVEEFKRLSAQFMEIVRTKDTGTLQFDIYLNDDQSECVIHERYRNSEALMAHAAHVGDLMQAIFALCDRIGLSVLLGEPSEELTSVVAGSGVRIIAPFLSM